MTKERERSLSIYPKQKFTTSGGLILQLKNKNELRLVRLSQSPLGITRFTK